MYINSNKNNVAISLVNNNQVSVAGIDNLMDGRWWISRVNVQGAERGNGIGSMLLKKAIEEVLKHDASAEIIVAPGGYGGDTDRQYNFYRKNGFVDANEEGLLKYKK
jgi:GNAT superfamily N-acetyltransferase